MDLALAGKVVVVTGGAKGIGEAVVRSLIAEGAWSLLDNRSYNLSKVRLSQLLIVGYFQS